MLLLAGRERDKEEKKKGEGSSNGGKNGDERGGGRGRDDDKKKPRGKFDKSKITCFECREKGHFKSECEASKKETALLAVADVDYEPGLLMAVACELAPGAEEQVADDVKPEGIKVNEVLCRLAAVTELEAAMAEAEPSVRGELAAANAKVDVMSDEYRTQAELLVYASEEKAKLLEVQRVLCNEDGVLHPLMNKTMTGAKQGSTRTTSTTPAAVTPLAALRAAITMPAAAMSTAASPTRLCM